MHSLIRNTLLNVGAFGVNSLAHLAVVPLVVGAYGLSALGLLALLRLLMPTGALGLLCPGLQTAAVRLTAGGRTGSAAALRLALALGLACGLAAAGLIWLVDGGWALRQLEAGAEEAAGLMLLRDWLAAIQPLLFLAFVAQGVVMGRGGFGLLRLLDVAATLAFTAAVGAGAAGWLDLQTLLSVFLALQTGKALLLLLAAFPGLRAAAGAAGEGREGRRRLAAELRVLAPSDLVWNGGQQAPPLLISALGGVDLLGLFEALRRIPNALKQLGGLARTAILPTAIEIGDRMAYRRALALRGSFVVGLCLVPLFLTLCVFAGDLLALWLGPAFAAHAWIFVLLLLETLVLQTQGVLIAAGAADLALVRREMSVRTLQTVALLAILPWTLQDGDLLPAAAVMLAVSWLGRLGSLRFYLPFFALDLRTWSSLQGRLAVAALLPAAAAAWAAQGLSPELRLLLAAPVSCLAGCALALLLAQVEERAGLRQVWQVARRIGRRA